MAKRTLFKNLFRVEKMMSDNSYSGQQISNEAEFAKEISNYFNEFLDHASIAQIECSARIYDGRNGVMKTVSGFCMRDRRIANLRTDIRFDYTREGKIDYVSVGAHGPGDIEDFISKVDQAYKEGKSRYIAAIRYYNIRTGEFIRGWQADDISTIR